nr:restriction endonuclease subunit S [uncultured Lachnoanaerobaculum sp.]
MSKLEELIKELCPNGVEYKNLGDIGQVKMCKRILKAQTNESGGIPFYKIGNFGGNANSYISEELFKEYKEKYSYPKVGEILISAAGTIGRTVVYDGEPAYYQDSNIVWLSHDESLILNTFLKYCYELQPWNISSGGTIARLYNDNILKAKVPVPPLEVQREIVRILDSFTFLTAELTAELTARKKQYEYYRDELLKPHKGIPMVTLKEIAGSIYRGTGIKRDQVTEDGVPCVRYGEIYTTYNTWFDECSSHTKEEYVSSPKYFEHGDILFAITGESVEDISKSIAYIGHDKCLAGGDIVVMKHNQNPRYLAHVLNTSMAREQKSKGKVKSKVVHSNVSSIEQIRIPLPTLEVQERYADVLDNFEKICNDLNIGLPAEIEARKKQYEYYRDVLLTFAETGSTILTDRQTDRQK